MPPAKGTRSTGGSASSAKPPSGGKTTASDAARIQSTQAKAGNDTGKGSFPARAQAAAARNTGEAKAKTAKGGKAGN